MRLHMLAGLALAFIAAAPSMLAQKAEDVVRWSAKAPSTAVKPDGTATIELSAAIETGWHLYALTQPEGGPLPLVIDVAKGQPFTLDKERISGPLPTVTKGVGSEPDSFHYDDKVALLVPVQAPKAVKAGKHTVPLEVTYQVCSGSVCLRPATVVLSVPVTVAR